MTRGAPVALSVLALLLAAAAAAKAFLWTDEPEGTAPDGYCGVGLAPLDDLDARLARLEESVARPTLEPRGPVARFDSLEARVAALEERASKPSPVPPDATRASGDTDLSLLSDDDVLSRARVLAKASQENRSGSEGALRAWEEVLRRSPDAATWEEAWLGIGFANRALKRHDAEEAAFRAILDKPGTGETGAQWARYQIAWSQSFRGDVAGARETMAELVRVGGGSREIAGHARLYEAEWSLQLEDLPRARQALEAIVREHSGSVAPGSVWLVEQAKERLRRLEGR